MRRVDWTDIRVPAYRWLGKYVTLDETFYNIFFSREVVSTRYFQIFFLIAFLGKALIRNTIIFANYTMQL